MRNFESLNNYHLITAIFLAAIFLRCVKKYGLHRSRRLSAGGQQQGQRNNNDVINSSHMPVATAVEFAELGRNLPIANAVYAPRTLPCEEPPKTCDGLPLPDRWEEKYTNDGRKYFFDRSIQLITWEDPRRAQFEEMHRAWAQHLESQQAQTQQEIDTPAFATEYTVEQMPDSNESTHESTPFTREIQFAAGVVIGFLFRPALPILQFFLPREAVMGMFLGGLANGGGRRRSRGMFHRRPRRGVLG